MENREYYVDKHDTEKIKFGLDKIYGLLDVCNNPQNKLKVIHVAGTNGKGSVSNFLATILAYGGYKVGKISSPVVFSKMEFAQVVSLNNNKLEVLDANEDVFKGYAQLYSKYIDSIKPSGYEVQIAFSLLYFNECKCDIVIVETGMGGRLDATNVFESTLCDVITSISMDHVGMIGSTLEEITRCKCGIITNNGNVVTTSRNKDVVSIINDEVSRKNATLEIANIHEIKDIDYGLNNNKFIYKNENHTIKLNGKHQMENAIVAIEVCNILKKQGYSLNEDSIKRGLFNTEQKGRFYLLNSEPIIITDGAHNEDGSRCLVEAVDTYFEIDKHYVVYITAVFRDKEYKGIINNLVKNASEIWTFATDNPRCLASEDLSKTIKSKSKDIKVRDLKNIDNVIEEIKNNNYNSIDNEKKMVYVFSGSLSFMKEVYGRLI